ncbi:MAG: hypothetical protein FJ104_07435 [Deltaproteobacteria bacterium]|nr:hypothetical protein [Deltaproteobacteria bacterium]
MRNQGRGDEEPWQSKFTNGRMHAGDTVQIVVPSSGGYGDPAEREPELVLADVLDGFTSLEQARETYLVAIDPATLELDPGATEQLRSAKRPAPS